MKKTAYLLCAIVFFAACSSGDKTFDSLESASERALKSDRDILLIVSSSDECHACVDLYARVLTNPAWKPERDFVVCLLDQTELLKREKPERHAANERLKARYGIRFYPTVLLCGAKGQPYFRGGYNGQDVAQFTREIADMRQSRRGELAGMLAKATNAAKARIALGRLREWNVDATYYNLKALAMGGAKTPELAIELADYWFECSDHAQLKHWLGVLEQKWPDAHRDTVIRHAVKDVERGPMERMEWKTALGRLEPFAAKQPGGSAGFALYSALAEIHYQLRERQPAIASLEKALPLAVGSKQRERTAERLAYLKKQDF